MQCSWLMQRSALGGLFLTTDLGFYWALLVAQMVKCCLQLERPRFDPWVGRMPSRRTWQPTPALLPGKSYERRSLIGYSPWGRKESDITERLQWVFITGTQDVTHKMYFCEPHHSQVRGKGVATYRDMSVTML